MIRCDFDIDDETLNRSGYGDIATFHFIWEGAENFYVTGYDEHGSDIGGYNDLMTQQRRSIILLIVGNYLGESSLLIWNFIQQIHGQRFHIEFRRRKHRVLKRLRLVLGTETDYGHVLYGPGWEKLKLCFDFAYGKRVVLTNMLGNDLRVLVFRDDGYEINHENLPHTKVILDTAVKKETQKEIDWYDLVDSERFLINGYDAMLEDLGIKDGSILFSRFRIPGKSFDEGLNSMEVVLGTGKSVVIEEVMEDDEVKEASETGNSSKQLLSVTENDVHTKTKPSTLPWSFESLYDYDIIDHPPWSSENMNEKRNKRLSEEFQFKKLLFDIDMNIG
ncbi:hypothetical protein Tco_1173707 [Tanacetum coccineum]